jgi:hypothetical protein
MLTKKIDLREKPNFSDEELHLVQFLLGAGNEDTYGYC